MISSAQYNVGTTAQLLATGAKGGTRVYISSPNTGSTFYLGASSVTSSNGFTQTVPNTNNESNAYFFDIAQNDTLYAVVASGTIPLTILVVDLP